MGIIIILAVHASHAVEYKVLLALPVPPAPTGLLDRPGRRGRPGHRDRPDGKGNQAQRAHRVYRGFKE